MFASAARNSLGSLCKADSFLTARTVLTFNLKNTTFNNPFNSSHIELYTIAILQIRKQKQKTVFFCLAPNLTISKCRS